MIDYQGKVAVITGAASGVGRGLSLYCASIGMKLALGDINGDKLKELEKELRNQTSDVLTYVFDVSKDQEFKTFAEKTIAEFNAVDIFFNNAGVSVPGEIWSLPAREWEWVMDVNVLGPVNGIRAFKIG
ncbi:MAG: SDR family NAD(P)-dependent oxidoreductase, partial [Syntrophomonadaceae bacterium]|nr:SDR family NAD(P)-dependent oxidoreductase [Syntrophomonadaceae bacterium]